MAKTMPLAAKPCLRAISPDPKAHRVVDDYPLQLLLADDEEHRMHTGVPNLPGAPD